MKEKLFDYPKYSKFIEYFLRFSTQKDSTNIILDFFSGSATTAHATMKLNAEDGGNRKYIMVQIPEETNEDSEAYKAGYKTISDIGKERIRRAGKKIKEDNQGKDLSNFDFGFRVFKVDSTNMKDVYHSPKDTTQEMLLDLESNIKEDRTPEDLLTQVMLILGLELSSKIEEKDILGNKVFFVENNCLIACFDEEINFEIIDEIAKEKPLQVVFRDSSFKKDKDKINLEEKFKLLSPETKIKVI
jgi:adenine-specific DNA-methyltransferase